MTDPPLPDSSDRGRPYVILANDAPSPISPPTPRRARRRAARESEGSNAPTTGPSILKQPDVHPDTPVVGSPPAHSPHNRPERQRLNLDTLHTLELEQLGIAPPRTPSVTSDVSPSERSPSRDTRPGHHSTSPSPTAGNSNGIDFLKYRPRSSSNASPRRGSEHREYREPRLPPSMARPHIAEDPMRHRFSLDRNEREKAHLSDRSARNQSGSDTTHSVPSGGSGHSRTSSFSAGSSHRNDWIPRGRDSNPSVFVDRPLPDPRLSPAWLDSVPSRRPEKNRAYSFTTPPQIVVSEPFGDADAAQAPRHIRTQSGSGVPDTTGLSPLRNKGKDKARARRTSGSASTSKDTTRAQPPSTGASRVPPRVPVSSEVRSWFFGGTNSGSHPVADSTTAPPRRRPRGGHSQRTGILTMDENDIGDVTIIPTLATEESECDVCRSDTKWWVTVSERLADGRENQYEKPICDQCLEEQYGASDVGE